MDGDQTFSGVEGEDVVVSSGDVTSISDSATGADAVAAGGTAIATSLSPERDVLNIAFVTGSGDVQFVQIKLEDLRQGAASASGADVVVSAELTALHSDAISSGSGAAIPVGTVAVAAALGEDGELTLSFVDGNGDLQLIETNVAALLEGPRAGDDGGTAAPAEPDSADAGR
jgi:type IV pilus biogenesis protein CpaD/CtpE